MTEPHDQPYDPVAAENLLRAIEDPATYWEERCAKAEAEVTRLRDQIAAVRALQVTWGDASMARLHGWPIPQMIQDLSDALEATIFLAGELGQQLQRGKAAEAWSEGVEAVSDAMRDGSYTIRNPYRPADA